MLAADMGVPVPLVDELAGAVGASVSVGAFMHVRMINIMSSIQETFPTNCTNMSFLFLKVNDVPVLPQSTVGCKACVTIITPETFPHLNIFLSVVGCGSSRLMTELLCFHCSGWLEMDCWSRVDVSAESSNILQQWSWKYMQDRVRRKIAMVWNRFNASKTSFWNDCDLNMMLSLNTG